MKLEIMFKCDKAAHICDKSQYAESSWWERRMTKMHHMMCKVCREHSALNSKLSRLINRANLKPLSDEKKSEMQQRIQEEIDK